MSNLLSNKRSQYSVSKEVGNLTLNGEVTVNDSGIVQSVNGSISTKDGGYGNFNYSMSGDQVSQSVNISNTYRKQACVLVDDVIAEIENELKTVEE